MSETGENPPQTDLPALLEATMSGGFQDITMTLYVHDAADYLKLPAPVDLTALEIESVGEYVLGPDLTVRVTDPSRNIVRFRAVGHVAIRELEDAIVETEAVKELKTLLRSDYQRANAGTFEDDRTDPDPHSGSAHVKIDLTSVTGIPITFYGLRGLIDSTDTDPDSAWRPTRNF